MTKSLVVKNNIRINAPLSRVWEVLTKPKYIRIWDRLPEDFGDFDIDPATVIEWPGYSRLSVIEFIPNQKLRYELYVPTWEERVTNIGYTYTLTVDNEGNTWLGVEIGDFAILAEGDKYYDTSVDFEKTASQKIKELAEKREIVF